MKDTSRVNFINVLRTCLRKFGAKNYKAETLGLFWRKAIRKICAR
jgi:hypothetical protein